VIGFPALASTSMDQGRQASCHMLGAYCESRKDSIPYGVYTIPEISIVGKTGHELTQEKVPTRSASRSSRGSLSVPDYSMWFTSAEAAR
jgi:pyruvate/2-oxoglutarate dehydrogenase complex dihydrolipoamide dehydrogenase (E3) component